MSCRLATVVIRLGSAASLVGLVSVCAQPRLLTYGDERCGAVLELPDGSWQVNSNADLMKQQVAQLEKIVPQSGK
ncbi:MAG: hypothetical protein ACLPY1_21910 [Terracidiphilus sp.]